MNKFRGKRIDNGEWIYGYSHFNFNCEDRYVPFISWKDDSYVGNIGEQGVHPETIGQYTSLYDKNGKEIYGGDIVKYEGGIAVIYWDDEIGGFYGEIPEDISILDIPALTKNSQVEVEIIGNTTDNPEMIEGE